MLALWWTALQERVSPSSSCWTQASRTLTSRTVTKKKEHNLFSADDGYGVRHPFPLPRVHWHVCNLHQHSLPGTSLESTTNIHNSSGYARGAAQILYVNAINDKSCTNSTTNIHDSSGYTGDAVQIPHANAINDNSCPNLTTDIHNSSGYTRGAAQIPHANAINNQSHPNLTTNTHNLQVTPEALPKFHR